MKLKVFLTGNRIPVIKNVITQMRHGENLTHSVTFVDDKRTVRVTPITSQRAEVTLQRENEVLERASLLIDRQPPDSEIDFETLMRRLGVFGTTMRNVYQCLIDDGHFSPFEIEMMSQYTPKGVESVTGYLSYKWMELHYD